MKPSYFGGIVFESISKSAENILPAGKPLFSLRICYGKYPDQADVTENNKIVKKLPQVELLYVKIGIVFGFSLYQV